MKYYIGKIGQKLIFNRTSKNASRSNTNGNVGAYTFFNLLIEKLNKDEFVSCLDDDLDSGEYLNCHHNLSKGHLKNDGIGIFMIGIVYDENVNHFIDELNKTNIQYILFFDDFRCLDTFNRYDYPLTNLPKHIFGQMIGHYIFKNTYYHLDYAPLEKTILYNSMMTYNYHKTKDCVVIANDSNNEYDRLSIVRRLVNDKIDVYGRLNKTKQYSSNFKGELDYLSTQKQLQQSHTTLLIPVEKNVITSKYVEAIMNGTYPIFYKDYLYDYTDIQHKLVISSHEELQTLLLDVSQYRRYILDEQSRLHTKYYDGQILVEEFLYLMKSFL